MSKEISATGIKELLEKVGVVLKHSEEAAKLRHENFNIFPILRKAHDEEFLHSAFIAVLLDPRGSHDHGTKFLKLFAETFGISKDLVVEITSVEVEKYIPQGTTDDLTGRIDILISAPTLKVAIENKIYATDQPKQLFRYRKYLGEKGNLIYLTLFGKEPSEQSIQNGSHKLKTTDYSCKSYATDVVNWLEACHKEAAYHPPLRETIKQYLHLVKRLTGQLTDTKMEKEIISAMNLDLHTARFIHENYWKAHEKSVYDFFQSLKVFIEKELGKDWEVSLSTRGTDYEHLKFRYKNWNENISICIEGQKRFPWHDTIIGIRAFEEEISREQIKERIDALGLDILNGSCKESPYWPAYVLLFNLNNAVQDREMLYDDPNKLVEMVAEKIKLLTQAASNAFTNLV